MAVLPPSSNGGAQSYPPIVNSSAYTAQQTQVNRYPLVILIPVIINWDFLIIYPISEPELFISGSAVVPILAPAPAIYYHLKLFYNISTIPTGVLIVFLHPSMSIEHWASPKLTAVNIYLKHNFASGSRSQIISASPTPAPQHRYFVPNVILLWNSIFFCYQWS